MAIKFLIKKSLNTPEYRYFRICKPVKHFLKLFSTKRLFFYFFTHIGIILGYSTFDKIVCSSAIPKELIQIYGWVEFGMLNVFYMLGIIYTVFAYVSIIYCIEKVIKTESSLMGKPLKESSSDLSISYNTFVTSPEHRREEKHYAVCMRIYSIVLVLMLLLRYGAWLCLCVQFIVTGEKSPFAAAFVVYKISVLVLYLFYFGSNVVIFYENNEEFKLKLTRPIKNRHFQKT